MSNRSFLAATIMMMVLITAGGHNACAQKGKAAPAQGAPKAAANPALNQYLDRLRGRLDKNWYVPDGKHHVTLTTDLAADGTVTNLNISSSPSDTQAEQAASDAFNQSQPLESLPAGIQSVKLILSFESTADPHGDSTRNISAKMENIVNASAQPPAGEPKADDSGAGGSSN